MGNGLQLGESRVIGAYGVAQSLNGPDRRPTKDGDGERTREGERERVLKRVRLRHGRQLPEAWGDAEPVSGRA